jgi:hypothetical protein
MGAAERCRSGHMIYCYCPACRRKAGPGAVYGEEHRMLLVQHHARKHGICNVCGGNAAKTVIETAIKAVELEDLDAYWLAVECQFLLSPVVLFFLVWEREERLQEGFIRIRTVLSNGDLLEAFEFVVTTPDGIKL